MPRPETTASRRPSEDQSRLAGRMPTGARQRIGAVRAPQHDCATRGVGEDMQTGGIPGRGDVPRGAVEQTVAGAVAADDPQSARGDVRDPRVRPRAFPGGVADAVTRERPADVTPGSHRGQLVVSGHDQIEAVRRPGGVLVGAQSSFEPVASDEPDAGAAGRDDEQASAGREREERGGGVLDPDRLAYALEHGPPRWREDRRRRHHGRSRKHPQEQAGARSAGNAVRSSFLVGAPDDLPRALFDLIHASSSFSRSRPRRRRELTVPRGRSRSSAISPGVYSST